MAAEWDFKPIEIVGTSIAFLVGGLYLSIAALELGQLGYQGAGGTSTETGKPGFFLADRGTDRVVPALDRVLQD